ncbi:hypothetical protein [Streptomyces sp. NPDC017993]|uniref:hypothetical protein n=1 Tax=Streptomyces sp. NPDC017993 TaxID=3365027 RepID=UPI0037A9A066
MTTLGNPASDLALMLPYPRPTRLVGAGVAPDAGLAPGFPSEAEIIARHDARSVSDRSDLCFYLCLAAFKVAAIRRWHARSRGAGRRPTGRSAST